MRIRPFYDDDAPALAALFHAAVHQIAARDYSAAQVAAWSPAPPDPARYRINAPDGRVFLVALDHADAPIAYADLEATGHIDHLYCRPDAAGAGVTIALYEAIEAVARDRAMTLLFVEASEPARRFFERRGFAVEQRRDFAIGNVPIHNYRMTKRL